MDQLYKRTKELVDWNLEIDNDNIKEIFYGATLAIFLTNPELATKRLFDILNQLETTDLTNNDRNGYISYKHGNFTTLFDINYDKVEKKTIIYQSDYTNNNSIYDLANMTHDLYYLMRLSEYVDADGNLVLKSGVSINHIDTDGNIKKKNYQFEEAIIQRQTTGAINNLKEYIKDWDLNTDSLLFNLKNNSIRHTDRLKQGIVSELCDNQEFEELLDKSFSDVDNSVDIVSYYNKVMNSNNAFNKLSKAMDQCYTSIENRSGCTRDLETIIDNCKKFQKKSKVYKKRH